MAARLRQLPPAPYYAVKTTLFFVLLAPALFGVWRVFVRQTVPDPAEYLTALSGENAIRLLVATLAVTPLRIISGWNWLVKLRGMLGLFVFFYAVLHFMTYLLLDLQLDFSLVIDDILKRKYITVGATAFILLVPLAATSNQFMTRKLGAARWTRLHKLVYPICILAAVHLLWQQRGEDLSEPLAYLTIFVVLLALRTPVIAQKIKRR